MKNMSSYLKLKKNNKKENNIEIKIYLNIKNKITDKIDEVCIYFNSKDKDKCLYLLSNNEEYSDSISKKDGFKYSFTMNMYLNNDSAYYKALAIKYNPRNVYNVGDMPTILQVNAYNYEYELNKIVIPKFKETIKKAKEVLKFYAIIRYDGIDEFLCWKFDDKTNRVILLSNNKNYSTVSSKEFSKDFLEGFKYCYLLHRCTLKDAEYEFEIFNRDIMNTNFTADWDYGLPRTKSVSWYRELVKKEDAEKIKKKYKELEKANSLIMSHLQNIGYTKFNNVMEFFPEKRKLNNKINELEYELKESLEKLQNHINKVWVISYSGEVIKVSTDENEVTFFKEKFKNNVNVSIVGPFSI